MRGAAAALLLAFAAPVIATPAIAEPVAVPAQADWADAKQRVALADGPTLAYVETGDPDGPPALLVHGFTDNSRSWSLLAPHLADRRLIAVDLRGHGASEAPACCYGFDSLAHDLAEFLDVLDLDRVDVIGHSVGAIAAATLAATAPERVNRLVLISASLAPEAGPGSWMWDNIRPLEPPLDPDSQFMRDWYWNPNPVPADFLDRERAESAAVAGHVWQGVLTGMALTDLTPLAPAITQPTLILWGDQDALFGEAHLDRLRAAMPKARFETFPGYGHNMFWETPEAVAGLLADFLAP